MKTNRARINEILREPRMFENEWTSFGRVNSLIGLKMLIDDHVNDASTIVEIGSFAGKSSELFALHCGHIFCGDVWEGYWEIDGDTLGRAEQEFDKMSSRYKNISKIKKNSSDASLEFEEETLDLVYIDGAHDYENTVNDIVKWYPKLKRGGILAGHDYRYDPQIKVYEAVNEIFGNDHKIETYPDSSWTIRK